MIAQPTPSWNLSFASGKFLRFVSRRVFLIVATVSFFTLTVTASAQVYWNPAADGYTTQGGNGNWTATNGWWNGTTNVGWTTLPGGQNAIFEGNGVVGGNPGNPTQPNSVTFQNLTGNYSFADASGNMRSSSLTATTLAGQSISFAQWLMTSSTPSNITHNGAGSVAFGTLGTFGIRTIGLGGDGNYVVSAFRNSAFTLEKTGSGILHLNGATYDPGATYTMSISDGILFVDRTGTDATPLGGNFTWNSGAQIRLNLADLNTFDISGTLAKGTGAGFAFDFNGFNATAPGTYNLLEFGSTDFSVGDFSATGITFDPGLSGSFGLTGTALTFSVIPEPSTWMLMTAALTVLLVVRRRSALR